MSRLKHVVARAGKHVAAHPVGYSLFFICFFAFLVYSPLLFGAFINFDDGRQIFNNLRVKDFSWANLADALFTNYTGRGSAPSFAVSILNWAVTPNYAGFAAVNLVCFMGLILLFYRFSALFIAEPKWRAAAVLIFAVNSINADALGWMSSRCHIMGATFVLFCFVFWQKYRDDISRSRRFLWYILAFLSSTVAVWNKAIFVVTFALIGMFDLYRGRRIRLMFFLDKIPMALVALLPFFYMPLMIRGNPLERPGLGSSVWTTLMNDAGLLLEYFYRLFIPGPSAVTVDVYPVKTLFEVSEASSLVFMRMPPIFNIALLVLLSATLLYISARYKLRIFFCLYLMTLIALAPVMNIPRRWVEFAFRFELMPSFFFSIGVGAAGAVLWPRLPRLGRIVFAGMFFVFVMGHAAMSFKQARTWDTELTYWLACTENFPDSIICRQKAVRSLQRHGRLDEALEHSLQVHQYMMNYSPNQPRPSARHIAVLYRKMGRIDEALFYFEQSLLIDRLRRDDRRWVKDTIKELKKELKKKLKKKLKQQNKSAEK